MKALEYDIQQDGELVLID